MENQNYNTNENYLDDNDDIELDAEFTNEYKKGCKLYNFRRPDKFSKEHLKALQDIHRDFTKSLASILTSYLRMEVEIDVISVDQLTYDEYVCSMPPNIQNLIFKLNPLSGEISLGISPEVLSIILDRMLGGAGVASDHGKELTQVEELLTIKFAEKIVKILEDAWSTILTIKSEFVTIANGYHSVPIANAGEIVTLISFEVRLGQKNFGLMNICLPYPVLETVLPKLTPQYIYQHTAVTANEIGKNETLEKIKHAQLEMQIILGMADIEINDVLNLKTDDIIKLEQKLDKELVACVNRKKKFYVIPGTIQNKVCVKVVSQYQEEE